MTTFLEHIIWDNKIAIGLFCRTIPWKCRMRKRNKNFLWRRWLGEVSLILAQVLRIHTPKRPGQVLIESPRSSMYKSSLQSPFIPVFRSLKKPKWVPGIFWVHYEMKPRVSSGRCDKRKLVYFSLVLLD